MLGEVRGCADVGLEPIDGGVVGPAADVLCAFGAGDQEDV